MQNPTAEILRQTLQSPTFQRLTLAGPQRLQKSPYTRITIRPILLRDTPHLQISRFNARQDHTQNITLDGLDITLPDLLAPGFANTHIETTEEQIDLRLTKKLDLQISRKKRSKKVEQSLEPHNRTKQLPMPEGRTDRLLQVMGIMTADARIRPTMRSKFTQINEFLKLLDPLLDKLPGSEKPLKILDAGSGSAYLTLALHHYLTHLKKIPAEILGVDVNDQLIQQSIEKANDLNAQNLSFRSTPIGRAADAHPDIVVALHACDTATDDAIALAINTHAQLLLAVPCCHKNLNHSLQVPDLAPLHRHGILHARFADLITDTFRALLLRISGYKTDVIEFISQEHTSKNLMIRAIKTASPPSPQLLDEYRALKTLTHCTPYLESLLTRLPRSP
jgi:hypothetical protein